MSPVLESTPLSVQADMLEAVLAERYPKMMLGQIAQRFGVTFPDLQTILAKHGYPDTGAMRAAVGRLDERMRADGLHHPSVHDETDEGDEAFRETFSTVPVERIHPDPTNPRDTLTGIDELADSIVQVGLLQPIVVRREDGQLVVVAGHRRLAAIKHLKWSEVNVIIRSKMRPDHVLAAMLIENGQRTDLDPIEEARALHRLKSIDECTDGELAKKIGRSQPYVSGRLIEGTNKGRLNSGKVGTKGVDRNWHLGPNHDLAQQAKARCNRMQHPRGRRVGGMACGQCWESVIRADERDHIHKLSAQRGECLTCGAAIELAPVAP